MPPPSALAIATSSLQRLVKEEASYHKELESQEKRLAKLLSENESAEKEGEEGNKEFEIKQERAAIAETQAVFPQLKKKIADAMMDLDDKIGSGSSGGASQAEVEKAREAVEKARELLSRDQEGAVGTDLGRARDQ